VVKKKGEGPDRMRTSPTLEELNAGGDTMSSSALADWGDGSTKYSPKRKEGKEKISRAECHQNRQ